MADVEADLLELRGLAASCERPRVKAMLDAYIAQLEPAAAAAAASTQPSTQPSPMEEPTRTPGPEPLTETSYGPSVQTASQDSETLSAALPADGSVPVSAGHCPTTKGATPAPVRLSPAQNTSSSSTTTTYTSIGSYGWDQDDYGKEPNNVYVYLTASMFEGIGEARGRVECDFGERSFDLKIHDFKGKNQRLLVNNLDKKIVPSESKAIVKKNRITITLRKVKGQYGYDSWLDLTAKRAGRSAIDEEKDPGAGLMDMMKQMYDEGDDQLRKTLGGSPKPTSSPPPGEVRRSLAAQPMPLPKPSVPPKDGASAFLQYPATQPGVPPPRYVRAEAMLKSRQEQMRGGGHPGALATDSFGDDI